MVRIRYSESEGVLTSRPMVAGSDLVTVVLDTVNNKYSLSNSTGVLASGEAVDVAMLKKKAKQAAKTLGVVFQDEVRRREPQGETLN